MFRSSHTQAAPLSPPFHGAACFCILESTSPSALTRCHCPGCGTQHPQRFACVLLAAAPTATPCFRHWRRSSLLLLTRGVLAFRKAFPLRQRLPSLGELSSECETERLKTKTALKRAVFVVFSAYHAGALPGGRLAAGSMWRRGCRSADRPDSAGHRGK